MAEQWLEVLKGVTAPKNQENQVTNGLRERVGNAMQGYAIKEYHGLTAVNLVRTINNRLANALPRR